MSRVTSDIDPFSPEFRANPYPYYARLRALGTLVWLDKYAIWCVTDYAGVKAVLSDWENFSNRGGSGITNLFKEPGWRKPSIILDVDPPEHNRTRSVLSRVFSPKALRAMRPNFEAVAAQLIDSALEAGTIDAVNDLAVPFPLTVFPDAVGMPKLDRHMMVKYGGIVFGAFGPATEWYHELLRDADEVGAWIDTRCEREALQQGGLGQQIYAAADAGMITTAEAKLLVRSLLSAGVDTTIDGIGLALRCIADSPENFDKLKAAPSLASNLFEEAVRYDSSTQFLFRTTSREVEFAGQKMGQYEKVLVMIASAGRDEAKWPDADRFDITRRVLGQIGYGAGVHACVAQMMARLEGEVFFQALAQKVDTITPAGEPRLRLVPGLRGLQSLPITLTARKDYRPAPSTPQASVTI